MSHAFRARLRGLAIAFAVVGASSLVLASAASAKTISVSNTEQFVKAVGEANGDAEANTIVVAGGSYLPGATVTFTNKSGLQTVEGPATTPPARLTGSAVEPFPSELFVIETGVSVTFKNVEITAGGGNGIPAVVDNGTLGLEESTVAGNKGAGVIEKTGATATVKNSTISDGLDFGFINDAGTASFFNSTVAFNKNGGIETTGTLNLTNTIVAENTGSGNCVGAATTSDHSLDSDGTCKVEKSAVNPLLQTQLLNNGGSTPLHSLKPGSPAIDAGNTATCLTTSQEGQPRPDVAATACDIGADEFNETPPTITVPANITVGNANAHGAKVSFTVEAGSTDDAIRSVACLPVESGGVFPIGTTTETCTATDGHESTASGSFKVTVKPPRWFKNGILLGTAKEPTLSFGSITLENATLHNLTCKNVLAANVWNESERALESVTGYMTFECKAEAPCTVTNTQGQQVEGIYATAETPPSIEGSEAKLTGSSSLPWPGEVIEREAAVHQVLTHRVKIWIVLPPPSVGKGVGCLGTEIPFEAQEGEAEQAAGDEPAPVTINGTKNGLHPSHSEFTGEGGKTEKGFPRTGRLISPVVGPGYTTASKIIIGGGKGSWELITDE